MRTSSTFAVMIRIEESTTLRVDARPTPSVPCVVVTPRQVARFGVAAGSIVRFRKSSWFVTSVNDDLPFVRVYKALWSEQKICPAVVS